MAKIKNVKRGDTCVLETTVTNPETGAAVDLTGYTAFLTVKAAPSTTSNANDDASAVVSMTQAPVTGTPEDGIITFEILPETTTNILPETYYYDIQVKSPDGAVYSSKTEEFIVVADATRRTS